jgi:hypothetical protein
MPCDIVTTPGSALATSYADIAAADAYFAAGAHLFGATWLAASEASKCAALKQATRHLDDWFLWAGTPTTTTQALQWPRGGLSDRVGNAQDQNALPVDVVRATCEVAQAMLVSDVRADSDLEVNRITSLTVGSVALAFGSGVRAKAISDQVTAMLRHWGAVRDIGGTRSLPLVRV